MLRARLQVFAAITALCYASTVLCVVPGHYRFEPSGLELSQIWVHQTFQDSQGYLWFVTQEGLNRYDGYEVRQFRYNPSNPGSLASDAVTGIAEDQHGSLWVTSIDAGLHRYEEGSNLFEVYAPNGNGSGPLSSQIWTLWDDPEGGM